MIDLCVVNYNTVNLLDRFIKTLHHDLQDVDSVTKSNKYWSLFISDNDSTDGTIDYIKDISGKYHIDKLFINRNIGYAAACNLMASKGDSEIIGLLNADVWMKNEDVTKIVNIFNNNSDIHILGVKQRDEQGRITHAGIVGTNVQPVHRGWMLSDPQDTMFKDNIECVTVSGSAYFIRRNVWNVLTNNVKYKQLYPDAIGAFLPTKHYYEETWCSYFARHLGYNVVYDGSVSIGHSWHASSPKRGEGESVVDQQWLVSQSMFRKACDYFGIHRD
jgi:GT2 family glycosyltransferase